ncbi:MAG TPA: hypothetical protein VM733_07380 [Thermoanaerobaculia bacterium]|nr:hypothetical protein [Thermoanaerobaculia bacterium]
MFRAAVLLLALTACATRSDCPDPAMESMAWRPVEGTVTSVDDPRTFHLSTTDHGEITVTIPNLGDRAAENATAELRRMIGGKRVTVFISSSRDVTPAITGEVHVGRTDVANEMLRKGWTDFVEAPAYTVSATSECENRLAATRRH